MRVQLILSLLAIIGFPALMSGLEIGDAVSVEAIRGAQFVQGTAPERWEKDKVYVLECWATWCGPCIAAIPHLNGLHDRYRDQGLVVIGMNVWEDGLGKVAGFVQEKGEGMSYPVAYIGKGGDFEESWLEAAGIRSIPQAFVVREGKLWLTTHPAQLTSKMIESLLEGGEEADALMDQMKRSAENKEALKRHLEAFAKAMDLGDVAAMEEAMIETRTLNPDDPSLNQMALGLALMRKQWVELKNLLEQGDAPVKFIVNTVLPRIDEEPNVSPELLRLLVDRLKRMEPQPFEKNLGLARLQVKLGNRNEAIQSANALLEEARARGGGMTRVCEVFVESLSSDNPLTLDAMGLSPLPYQRNKGLIDACRTGTLEEVKAWLRQGADVNAKSRTGFKGATAIHEAAGRGSLEMVKVLIAEGADVNSSDELGNTPLFRAGNPETLEALLAAGADPSAENNGETVLEWADRKGFDWKSKVLRRHETEPRAAP